MIFKTVPIFDSSPRTREQMRNTRREEMRNTLFGKYPHLVIARQDYDHWILVRDRLVTQTLVATALRDFGQSCISASQAFEGLKAWAGGK